jgi:ATP-dependent Lhr-like helicase
LSTNSLNLLKRKLWSGLQLRKAATIAHLRREIEPVPPATFLRFLFEWQHVATGSRLTGESGVLEIIDQLQGFETAAAAWEDEILGARIEDYQPSYLDNLCLG